MKWVAVLFVLLLVIAVIIAGLYAALPWIIPALIGQQAAARGVLISELEMQRPALGATVVDRISLQIGDNEVRAEGILLGYTFASLSIGEATSVEIDKILVTARQNDLVDEQALEVGELLDALPGMLAGVWDMLPAQSLVARDVRVDLAGIRFSGVAELSRALASFAGRLGGLQALPPLQIEAEIEPGGMLRGAARDVGVPDNVLALQADLAAGRGDVTGSWSLVLNVDNEATVLRMAGAAPFAFAATGWSLQSGLVVDIQAGDWRVALEVSGAEGNWEVEPLPSARVSGYWRGALGLDPDAVSGRGGVSIEVGSDGIQFGLEPATVLDATGFAGDDWSVAGMRFELSDVARLHMTLNPVAYRLEAPMRLAVKLDRLVWNVYGLSPLVDLTVDTFAGDLDKANSDWQVAVPALQLTGSGRVSGNLSGPYALEFRTTQRITRSFLADLLPGKGRVYDLDKGRIESRGKLRVGESGATGEVSMTVKDLAGHYEEITISGVNSDFSIGLQAGAWKAGPGRVTAALMDVGFPITDIQASVTVTADQMRISEFTGRTLGGELRAAAANYDIASGSSEFPLEVTGIQLAAVLALEGESITGSGVLDGRLPLQINDNQVRVSQGRFSARAPGGVLRVGDAEQAAASLNQTGIGFAIAALGDYRYGVMDVDVTYEVNGDLLLGIHLQGRNPKFESGRPIHYNLNVSENIPVLLESLQLSDEVGKRLEGRLKKPPERRATQ